MKRVGYSSPQVKITRADKRLVGYGLSNWQNKG
jgi:hypothetical protein